MASVKVFPRLDKANSEGKVPIYLHVTKNRKSKYIALDAYVFSKDETAFITVKILMLINSFLFCKPVFPFSGIKLLSQLMFFSKTEITFLHQD